MHHIELPAVVCPAVTYFFSNYLINGTIFEENIENKICFDLLYNFVIS